WSEGSFCSSTKTILQKVPRKKRPELETRLSSNDDLYDMPLRGEQKEVGVTSWRDHPLLTGNPQEPRKIEDGEPNGFLKFPSCKTHHVPNNSIEHKHATDKFAIVFTTISSHRYFERPEFVDTIRHTHRADRIGDENRALG